MAVEIIPKPPVKKPKWLTFLPYFSIGLLIATISGYFILDSFLKKAPLTIQNLEESIARLWTPQEIALEKEILGYQKKIKHFSFFLKDHLAPSHFFEFFEKFIHPEIWFSTISLWPRTGDVRLSGRAKSFPALEQQILIFRKEEIIREVKLTHITLGEKGEVIFNLDLSLSPEIFKFKF